MEIVEFIQKFFVYLLPGIFGVIIFNILNPHKERQYLVETVYALLFSFTSFAIVDVILEGIQKLCPCFVFKKIDIISYVSNMESEIPTANLIGAAITAFVLAFVFTLINSWNVIFKIAKKLHVTNRNDNLSVWEGFLDNNKFITVRDMITQNTYYGVLESFSDNSDLRELFLKDVQIFDEEGTFLYHVDDIYLSRNHNEFTIETFSQRGIENEKE